MRVCGGQEAECENRRYAFNKVRLTRRDETRCRFHFLIRVQCYMDTPVPPDAPRLAGRMGCAGSAEGEKGQEVKIPDQQGPVRQTPEPALSRAGLPLLR